MKAVSQVVVLVTAAAQLACGFRLARRTTQNQSASCPNWLIIGDFGGGNDGQKKVAKSMAQVAASKGSAAIFGIGDNIYPDGATGKTSNIVSKWSNYYMNHEALKIPWYIVAGNHDWHSDVRVMTKFTSSSENKGEHWQMPNFYYKRSFSGPDSTNIDFFFLDTEIWKKSSKVKKYIGSGEYSKQKSWFESELSSSSADWKIVVGHINIYSAGSHGISSQLRSDLEPILRKHGAQMMISGHDHNRQLMQLDGLNYVISGAGAYGSNVKKSVSPAKLVEFHSSRGFVGLEICNKESATLTIYNDGGGVDATAQLSSAPPGSGGSSGGSPPRRRSAPRRRSSERRRRRRSRRKRSIDDDDVQTTCQGMMLEDVDLGCSADGCTVVVDRPESDTCEMYCADHGLACTGAWRQNDESCVAHEVLSCSTTKRSNANMMCQCAKM